MFSRGARKSTSHLLPNVVDSKPESLLEYPHRISFYEEPPLGNVTLEEFESWAVDRLRVLAEIEASFIRDRTYELLKEVVMKQCNKYLMMHSSSETHEDLDLERKKDHVSHFVLRLAFCRSEELRAKFVKAETQLFKIRYEQETEADRAAYLKPKSFGGDAISEDDKNMYKSQLMATCSWLRTEGEFEKETFYRVHWTKVTELVSRRRVFLRGGFAFVPAKLQSSIVFQEFSTRLNHALELTARAIPALNEDERLLPVITHFSQGFLAGISGEQAGMHDASLGDEITKDMIDELSRKHFPACMRTLHNRLRQDNHLKHQARLQYTLFLKVLGLPIDEAIPFWRQSFANITDDKFNKEYKYNVRHSYGLEGKRANYSARNCGTVITQFRPSGEEAHGCPFREYSADRLKSMLSDLYKIPYTSPDMNNILHAAEAKHYHVACTRVFELSHGGQGLEDGESVTHPNQYAMRSRELEKAAEEVKVQKAEEATEATKMEIDTEVSVPAAE